MPDNITAPTTERTIDSLIGLIQELGETLGGWTADFFEKLLGFPLPSDLETSVGILVILTVFLAVTEFSKKILWFLVCVGWVLLIMRIAVEALNIG